MSKLDNMYYVYKHYINERLFYIGKGKNNRAFDFEDRSQEWKELVDKHDADVRVEIVGYFKSELDAYEVEKLLIKKYSTEAIELTNHVYNPVKDDLLKSDFSIKTKDGLLFNDKSHYKEVVEYSLDSNPVDVLESTNNLRNGFPLFVENTYPGLMKIKDELICRDYSPLLIMPKDKYKHTLINSEINNIHKFKKGGVIPNEYDCVVVDISAIRNTKINLDRINAVIINTSKMTSRNRALLSLNGRTDFFGI